MPSSITVSCKKKQFNIRIADLRYGQFASPYISMGNNPVSMTDPDGGYVMAPQQGKRYRGQAQQKKDRENGSGFWAQDEVQKRYNQRVEDLKRDYLNGEVRDAAGYIKNLQLLNAEYAGLTKGIKAEGAMYYLDGSMYLTANEISWNADAVEGLNAQASSLNYNEIKAEKIRITSDGRDPYAWTKMSREERAATGLTSSFTHYQHFVNGEYKGTHGTLGGALDAAMGVIEEVMKIEMTVEFTEPAIFAAAGGDFGMGDGTATSMSLTDYLTKTGKSFGDVVNAKTNTTKNANDDAKDGIFNGVPVISSNGFLGGAAVTLPSGPLGLIIVKKDEYLSDIDLLRHEFGHILQWKDWGTTAFLGVVGIPSLITGGVLSSEDHGNMWYERDANNRSWKYFNYPEWNHKEYPRSPKR